MREHVPCTKPLPLVDVSSGEGHVTVRKRTVVMKSPQDNNNQQHTAPVQHSPKYFKSGERKKRLQKAQFSKSYGGTISFLKSSSIRN